MHSKRGTVLLEAVLALAILGVVASGGVWLVSESFRTANRAYEAEANMRAANDLLVAVSLWPRADLDRHLGTTPQGPWQLRVDRLRPSLYTVALSDTATGSVLLRTALYRDTVNQ
jgi:type II secretory pathway pseudopilin PulG